MAPKRRTRHWRSPMGVILVLAVQFSCAFFFIWNILSSLIGLGPLAAGWRAREMVEIGAAVGLLLGLILTAIALRRTLLERNQAEHRLRLAAGAFHDVLQQRFSEWGLTPAERDVAIFALKGLSVAEIARLREASEGTIKSQTNAIYRKAGVASRPQLLSLFIEDLMDEREPAPDAPIAAGPAGSQAVSAGK